MKWRAKMNIFNNKYDYITNDEYNIINIIKSEDKYERDRYPDPDEEYFEYDYEIERDEYYD